jgi:hypothetical protein
LGFGWTRRAGLEIVLTGMRENTQGFAPEAQQNIAPPSSVPTVNCLFGGLRLFWHRFRYFFMQLLGLF